MISTPSSSWFAIPGKTPALTEAELQQQLPHLAHGQWSISSVAGSALEIKGEFIGHSALNRLGGVVKAGLCHGVVESTQLLPTLQQLVEAVDSSRYDIGLSVYGPVSPKWSSRLGLSLKKMLKSGGKAVRIVLPGQGTILSSVVVQKQLLQKGGREFILVPVGTRWWVGETSWVHQFEQWGAREFSKPDVSRERGLLPQKLGRSLINLTGLALNHDITIFDPYCGSGVILMEAHELGCQFCGSDLDMQAVVATRANVGLSAESPSVWQADARKVTIPEQLRRGHGAIVTEPYLGPVWHHEPSQHEKEQLISQLGELYVESLQHWRRHLAAGTPVVMIFPVIFNTALYPKIVDRIRKIPYSSSIGPIRYERTDQNVRRDVVVLNAA